MKIEVRSDVVRSARVMQMEGLFDVPPSESSHLTWDVDLPLHEREWSIGLIVGPSGSGKSTVAKNLWPDQYAIGTNYDWHDDQSVLDNFPTSMGVKDIIELVSSVGFSSPPAWVRPHWVLSTGEQFRVDVARALAEALARSGGSGGARELVVLDEFTSVVDRTVAQIGSCAIARTVRAHGPNLQMVAITCHYDVEEWLQPDWVYAPASNTFAWRSTGTRPKSLSASGGSIIPHGSYSSVITI